MTYVVIERGRVVRPVDRAEAGQWEWDRVCEHRMRGRYWCRMAETGCGYRSPRQCCEGGPRKLKPRRRRYGVTRRHRT